MSLIASEINDYSTISHFTVSHMSAGIQRIAYFSSNIWIYGLCKFLRASIGQWHFAFALKYSMNKENKIKKINRQKIGVKPPVIVGNQEIEIVCSL